MFGVLSLVGLGALLVVCQALYARYRGGLNAIPGPALASVSNIWKILAVYHDDMPRRNVEVHRKYGPVVRIGPNTVSFSSLEALHTIHGSRQAFPKSDFYKPASARFEGAPLLNLFSAQDVNYHASLKRRVATLYTKSAAQSLEPKIDDCVSLFTQKIREHVSSGNTAPLDMSSWAHFFAFDCLGELNVSRKFGFLESGRDIRGMIDATDKVLSKTGFYAQAPILQAWRRVEEFLINPRGSINPILQYTSTVVTERLREPTKDADMLNKFIQLRDSEPDILAVREIIAAIYINLMAGHDVLAVTLRAVLYYVARNPTVGEKLRDELAVFKGDHPVPYDELLKLPYLDAVIHEALRFHGNTGLVNERSVPRGGAVIDGFHIPEGTIVGVNPWVLHRNTDLFGPDVDVFRPERWIDSPEGRVLEMRRSLFAFGAGPRMCIGKNIAMVQLFKFLAEFYRNFTAVLADEKQEWHVVGNWVTKQTGMDMVVSRAEHP
ncbi:benzoate 4-monooxygenase cytochrome P450 [Xylariomycetidae sp. FL2044]|nr:benzoate 4-monooxygenase cytochrome P450 [Xylariomycetidae sp. FL2044]